jgi:probable selenium-dependent hydroxylase accessory protein YqeC
MLEDDRWRRLLVPGITAIVGAGGKTTVLERLGVYGQIGNLPIVISSTVPVEEERVKIKDPFDLILTDDVEKGEAFCISCVKKGKVPFWFYGHEENCYVGLPASVLEQLKAHHPEWYILVEADETHNRWLKAPEVNEPSLPAGTDTLIGVLNLQMLGHALTPDRVAGVETAAAIMGRPVGAVVTPALLAKLIKHPCGMFHGDRGRHILFCTGYDAVQHRMTEALLDDLESLKLEAIVLADGYRETCSIRQYIGVDSHER